MSTTVYEVDPMSAASPDMNDAEMAALRESIRTHGQLVPIVLSHDDRIIDGRKRYAACRALGIEPVTVILSENDDEAKHAEALNLLRTHYSVSQRTMYAAELANATRAEGTRRRVEHATGTTSKFRGPRVVTVPEAASIAGVHPSNVMTAKAVRRDAAPEVVEAVKRGDLTVYAAHQIAKNTPRDEQPAVAARVIAEKGNRKNALSRTLGTGLPRTAVKSAEQRIEKLWEHIEHAVAVLDEFADMPLPDDQARCREWAQALDRISKPLRVFRRRLREERGVE